MADISKIKLPGSDTVYNIKDATARNDISKIKDAITGGTHYRGVTTTALTDGATTTPITISGTSTTPNNGDIVIYNNKEFIWHKETTDTTGTWNEFGSTGSLKALAFKDQASASYKPAGSVSKPTFSGTKANIKTTITPEGSVSIKKGTGTANYTPQGSVSKPAITLTPTQPTVYQITGVGTLPSCTLPSMGASVADETLALTWSGGSFNAGTLPTRASFKPYTGLTAALDSAPTFTGTGVQLLADFDGIEKEYTSADYTPAGTVSQPTFSGTQATITVS